VAYTQEYVDIMQVACDDICKFRNILVQEKLEKKCEECPLAKILNNTIK